MHKREYIVRIKSNGQVLLFVRRRPLVFFLHLHLRACKSVFACMHMICVMLETTAQFMHLLNRHGYLQWESVRVAAALHKFFNDCLSIGWLHIFILYMLHTQFARQWNGVYLLFKCVFVCTRIVTVKIKKKKKHWCWQWWNHCRTIHFWYPSNINV